MSTLVCSLLFLLLSGALAANYALAPWMMAGALLSAMLSCGLWFHHRLSVGSL